MIYLALFLGQALNYLLITLNVRACAKGKILFAVVTDFTICVLSYKLVWLIAHTGTNTEILAYACGGSVGSTAAILLTRRWDHG